MMYKAFEDFYKEENIKHLLLLDWNGILTSPPFATEQCKEYADVWCFKKDIIKLDLPPATSKTNAPIVLDNDLWLIPYGIYDELNIVVQIKDNDVVYHKLSFAGKGQFYSIASNGTSAFSFPLGYEDTNYGLYINEGKVSEHKLPYEGKKLHMGTVYCNGRYWSMPRGDNPGYNKLLSFDGNNFESFELDINSNITRKFSDIIVKDNTLYSLPFGETPGMTEIVEFDTTTNRAIYHNLTLTNDFAKKYNCGVLVNNKIIALPYGDEYSQDSNWGVVFDTDTKESKVFDIGLNFGGKYRYRCGVALDNKAIFFPSGTPSCPIMSVDENTNIKTLYLTDYMLGRPYVKNNLICCMSYRKADRQHFMLIFDSELNLLGSYQLFA